LQTVKVSQPYFTEIRNRNSFSVKENCSEKEKKRMREKKKQTDKRSAALEKKEKEKQAAGDVLKTRSQYPNPDPTCY
jgi:hypothetical protein